MHVNRPLTQLQQALIDEVTSLHPHGLVIGHNNFCLPVVPGVYTRLSVYTYKIGKVYNQGVH